MYKRLLFVIFSCSVFTASASDLEQTNDRVSSYKECHNPFYTEAQNYELNQYLKKTDEIFFDNFIHCNHLNKIQKVKKDEDLIPSLVKGILDKPTIFSNILKFLDKKDLNKIIFVKNHDFQKGLNKTNYFKRWYITNSVNHDDFFNNAHKYKRFSVHFDRSSVGVYCYNEHLQPNLMPILTENQVCQVFFSSGSTFVDDKEYFNNFDKVVHIDIPNARGFAFRTHELEKFKNVEILNLNSCIIFEEKFVDFQLLPNTLKHLNVFGCEISNTFLSYLPVSIEHINLGDNPQVDYTGIMTLKNRTNLKSIELMSRNVPYNCEPKRTKILTHEEVELLRKAGLKVTVY